MRTALWIVRVLALASFLPAVFPPHAIASAFTTSAIGLALLGLALALLALAVVIGAIHGVLGSAADTLILFGALSLLMKWPRGIRGRPLEKLKLAYRGLRNETARQLSHCTLIDYAFCLVVGLNAIILGLAAGIVSFVVTVAVILLIAGVLWKWPTAPDLSFRHRLRIALREFLAAVRGLFH